MAESKLLLDYVYINEKERAGKIWMTQPIGGGLIKNYTWEQALKEARSMAAHIRSMNLEPGSRIAVISKNCAHFFMAELAIWMSGNTTVALYPTVNAETASYVLDHADAKLLFVGKLDTWDEVKPGVPEDLPCVAFPLAPANDYAKWDDIVGSTNPIEDSPVPARDDIAMIIYTSGSTGRPKGVMHAFGPMSDALHGMIDTLDINEEERILSYLPLAHVFERAYVECTSMMGGGHIFFAESLDTFVQDLQRANPTVFLSVPRLYLKFQMGVFKKLPAKKLDFLLKLPIISGLIKKKVLTGLGLQSVRLAGCGSAPIPAELIAWYRRLGLNLMEGYAMSEDFAFSHLSTEEYNEPGYVGVPYPGVKVKLSDEGEILIDSPGKMVGYFKEPEMTAESFTEDGFFKTGDRGERKSSGLLKITGRVKEIFKTSKGKYIAPAPIENILNNSNYVELSCVSGSGYPQPYAQVVIGEDFRDKLTEASVKAEVESALNDLLGEVNSKIEHHEHLQFIVVPPADCSIANGLLTPTMKIRRASIEDAVTDHVDGWYERGEKVFWG